MRYMKLTILNIVKRIIKTKSIANTADKLPLGPNPLRPYPSETLAKSELFSNGNLLLIHVDLCNLP